MTNQPSPTPTPTEFPYIVELLLPKEELPVLKSIIATQPEYYQFIKEGPTNIPEFPSWVVAHIKYKKPANLYTLGLQVQIALATHRPPYAALPFPAAPDPAPAAPAAPAPKSVDREREKLICTFLWGAKAPFILTYQYRSPSSLFKEDEPLLNQLIKEGLVKQIYKDQKAISFQYIGPVPESITTKTKSPQ